MGQEPNWLHQLRNNDWDLQDLQSNNTYLKSMVNNIFYQVDIKVEDVKPKMDKNGNIRKNDFIELSIEAKLLDVNERKAPAAENPKEQKAVKQLNFKW